jgi:hypothetical protein
MAKEPKETLFGDLENFKSWRKEWQGMPEFSQKDLTPYRSILVHFRDEEGVRRFAKLMSQTISKRAKFIWYPKVQIVRRNKVYVDYVDVIKNENKKDKTTK